MGGSVGLGCCSSPRPACAVPVPPVALSHYLTAVRLPRAVLLVCDQTKFLKEAGVFGSELSTRDALFCFCRSRLLVIDELRNRQRIKTADFIDFLEAICRYQASSQGPSKQPASLSCCLDDTRAHLRATGGRLWLAGW